MLATHKQDWEELATADPFWAVLSEKDKRGGGWIPTAFYARGEQDFSLILERAKQLGFPKNFGKEMGHNETRFFDQPPAGPWRTYGQNWLSDDTHPLSPA